MKRIFAVFMLLLWYAGFASAQQQVPLGTAIQNAAENISARVSRGSRIAVVAMQSDSEGLSVFLVDQLINAFVRQQDRYGFTVVSRSDLEQLFEQLDFNMSDFVDDSTAAQAGEFLGVHYVVSGRMQSIAGMFSFWVRMVEGTSAIRGSYANFVRNDDVISYLRGMAPAAPPLAAQPPARAAGPAGMVRVEGGTRVIGGRSVTLTGFYISRHLVTQGEWFELMGTTVRQQRDLVGPTWPIRGEGDNHPMYFVNWFDAIEFANARSRRAGLTPAYTISGSGANRTVTWNRGANGYRLPTEAEWEFAARGGMVCRGNFRYSGSNVAGEVAWYVGNSGGSTQAVGMLRPNALGIYDMSGNVSEWVWDWWQGTLPASAQTNPAGPGFGTSRVRRGGSWLNAASSARSVDRNFTFPSGRYSHIGFRLARP